MFHLLSKLPSLARKGLVGIITENRYNPPELLGAGKPFPPLSPPVAAEGAWSSLLYREGEFQGEPWAGLFFIVDLRGLLFASVY